MPTGLEMINCFLSQTEGSGYIPYHHITSFYHTIIDNRYHMSGLTIKYVIEVPREAVVFNVFVCA